MPKNPRSQGESEALAALVPVTPSGVLRPASALCGNWGGSEDGAVGRTPNSISSLLQHHHLRVPCGPLLGRSRGVLAPGVLKDEGGSRGRDGAEGRDLHGRRAEHWRVPASVSPQHNSHVCPFSCRPGSGCKSPRAAPERRGFGFRLAGGKRSISLIFC